MCFSIGDRVIATESLDGRSFPAVPKDTHGIVTAVSVWGGSHTVTFENGHTATTVAEWYLRKI